MLFKYHSFKFFFFIIILFPFYSFPINKPEPLARPEIKQNYYDDLFKEVKKQNWQMAKIIAKEYKDPAIETFINWLDISRPGSKHGFEYLLKFVERNPNLPSLYKIRKKIESSINPSMDPKKIINYYQKYEPITIKGSIDLLEAKIKSNTNFDKIRTIKEIWINKNLTYNQQKYFVKKYSKYWTGEDNWKRFDKLMWNGKTTSARRTLRRINGDYRLLGNARLALSLKAPNVTNLINKIPDYLKNDSGLIYERMRWRRKNKLDSASDFLINPPDNIQNVRNWWINARIVIRRLINKKKYSEAYQLLSNHKLPINSISGSEAEWLAGWVSLTFLNEPEIAKVHFEKLFENVTHSSSKSKAAFWIAKSVDELNLNSKAWYKESSKDMFSFYGQNSISKIGIDELPNHLIKKIKPTCCNDLIEIINFLIKADQTRRTYPFLKKALELSNNQSEENYILEIARKFDNKNFLINLTKFLKKKSLTYSYPSIKEKIPLKFNNKYDYALIHSIILQESAFKLNAFSHAGARGLMQLMPYTAKRVAKSINVKYYRKALLTNPQYNILLGATYIKSLLIKFKGSIPLALAGYNAGPGRVKIWLRRYGDPREGDISYINWIESIPISETRNYVKKVLSNFVIYQKVFNEGMPKKIFNLN